MGHRTAFRAAGLPFFLFVTVSSLLSAQSATDALRVRRFVRHIYGSYSVSTYSPFTDSAQEANIFSRQTVQLIEADKAATPAGYEGALDADPLCQCQDSDGLKLTGFKVASRASNSAEALVTLRFANPRETIKVRLILVKQNGKWLVDDVIPQHGASMRTVLTEAHSRKK